MHWSGWPSIPLWSPKAWGCPREQDAIELAARCTISERSASRTRDPAESRKLDGEDLRPGGLVDSRSERVRYAAEDDALQG